MDTAPATSCRRPARHSPRASQEAAPHGYPHLGLTARTLPLHYRRDADLTALRRRLEAWEAARGNPTFNAYNLETLPADLAFELVNVYVALRERFPAVYVDGIDFASDMGNAALGLAWQYIVAFPDLRTVASAADVGDATSLAEVAQRFHNRSLRRQALLHPWIRDVRCAGHIEVSNRLSEPKAWRQLQRFWDERDAKAARRGRPSRFVPMDVSRRALYLIHEFGHLVESEMAAVDGFASLEPAFRAISEVVFGLTPTIEQWRYHLGNYPAGYFLPGPHQGGLARQRSTVKALKATIGEKFGVYAATNRDELFAEVFALAYGGTPQMRRQLARFRSEIRAVLRITQP